MLLQCNQVSRLRLANSLSGSTHLLGAIDILQRGATRNYFSMKINDFLTTLIHTSPWVWLSLNELIQWRRKTIYEARKCWVLHMHAWPIHRPFLKHQGLNKCTLPLMIVRRQTRWCWWKTTHKSLNHYRNNFSHRGMIHPFPREPMAIRFPSGMMLTKEHSQHPSVSDLSDCGSFDHDSTTINHVAQRQIYLKISWAWN